MKRTLYQAPFRNIRGFFYIICYVKIVPTAPHPLRYQHKNTRMGVFMLVVEKNEVMRTLGFALSRIAREAPVGWRFRATQTE